MSQKGDGGQKPFSVGRGLLGAANTLNFNMNEQHSGRPMGGMSSAVGLGGMEGPDGGAQMSRRGGSGGSHLGSTMKLFASLGLSPSDLDALAELPEEDISVETLPHILMQLKSRKGASGERGVGSSMSSEAVYRGGRDGWDPPLGHGSADFGFSSRQDVSSGRGFGSNYGGDGRADRPYSVLSHQTSYGGGVLQSDSVFMQRRMGSPSSGKVQDFLGVPPTMLPHVCSLCDFDVHSTMEWNQHINGLQHAENRRHLLDMYPEWELGTASGRSGGHRDTPNLSAGLLGPPPMSPGSTGRMSSSWGGGAGRSPSGNPLGQNLLRSRVVVVKYDRKPLSNKTLFAFTEPFGRLREHLILKNKAFLEMSTHEEALEMVNYYNQHPASLYGKPVTFYLSQRLMAIEKDSRSSDRPMDRPIRDGKGHGSKVVFFSNLPREDEKKKELLTIAERFGDVEKHLFLTDQAFVQLGTVEDAEMLVKYYSVNPLTIRGRLIRLNICTKYKTLNVNRRQEGKDGQSRRSSRSDTTPSRAASSKSSSRSKEEKKEEEEEEEEEKKVEEKEQEEEEKEQEEEEKEKPDKPAEEEEKQSGVVKGGEDKKDDEDANRITEEEEEPGRAESVTGEEEELQEEEEEVPDGDDVTTGGVTKQEAESEGQTDTKASPDELEKKNEGNAEAAGSCEGKGDEPTEEFDQDFLENMEDFVTLDELGEDEGDSQESDSLDNSKRGGMRVVNIMGFRRGYNFIHELLGLAKPFGKVVKHLVLDLRPEAYIQFEREEDAISMAKFYNANVTASVCGRSVRITHSLTYPTIQCGSSRVVYIGQIPNVNYSNEDILKLAEPYGKIRKYFLHRLKRECFIEMDQVEDAEKMAEACKEKPLKFRGKRLTTYVSRKYKQLKHGHLCPSTLKRATSNSPPKSSQYPEEPPAKKMKEEMDLQGEELQEEEPKHDSKEVVMGEEPQEAQSSDDIKVEKNTAEKPPEVCEDEEEEEVVVMDTLTNQNEQTKAPPPADIKAKVAPLPLPPYNPDMPIGVEHVKMGFYCRICFLFYSNEDTAKKSHCSSRLHYDKLQKHLEKEGSEAVKKKMKKTA